MEELNPIYKRIKDLCELNGVKVTVLCKEVTGSPGNLSTWKKGNIRSEWLAMIAERFGKTADYILTGVIPEKGLQKSERIGKFVTGLFHCMKFVYKYEVSIENQLMPEVCTIKIKELSNATGISVKRLQVFAEIGLGKLQSVHGQDLPSLHEFEVLKRCGKIDTSNEGYKNVVALDKLLRVEAKMIGDVLETLESDGPLLNIPKELEGVRLAAHGGEDDWTQDEIERIAEFARFVKSQRKDG